MSLGKRGGSVREVRIKTVRNDRRQRPQVWARQRPNTWQGESIANNLIPA